MVVETRLFGTIDIDQEKIIDFPQGIVGFPEMHKFTLIFDTEKGSAGGIQWLQSVDEPAFAMPVMDPLYVKADYNPMVDDEMLKPLGTFDAEDMLILVTVTVPKELKNISVNLQAPLVINAANTKACQIVVDNTSGQYPIKFQIYDILAEKKGKAGEN